MERNWELKYEEGIGYWYEDETGKKSKIFSFAYKYSCGYGVVRENGKFAYIDENSKLSEGYPLAFPYIGGYGLVWLDNGKYAYRNKSGKLSEEYDDVYDNPRGYSLVKLADGKYAYRNNDGKLSESYISAEPYLNGFGYVQLDNGEFKFRDVDGNLFSKSEYDKINQLWEGKVDVYDLDDEVFGNERLLALIIKRAKNDARRFIGLASSDDDLKATEEYYRRAMEYVLSKAYKISRKNKLQKKREDLLDELHLR